MPTVYYSEDITQIIDNNSGSIMNLARNTGGEHICMDSISTLISEQQLHTKLSWMESVNANGDMPYPTNNYNLCNTSLSGLMIVGLVIISMLVILLIILLLFYFRKDKYNSNSHSESNTLGNIDERESWEDYEDCDECYDDYLYIRDESSLSITRASADEESVIRSNVASENDIEEEDTITDNEQDNAKGYSD